MQCTYRFCSVECVNKYFGTDVDSQELTPSSTSGISAASQATEIDLAQSDLEEKGESELEEKSPSANGIPDTISHAPPRSSKDAIWTVIHKLGMPIVYVGKSYTHVCLLCAQTKKWQRALCKVSHATNGKTHLILQHKTHELAVQERLRREQRSSRFVGEDSCANVKHQEVNTEAEPPVKRQKTWFKPKPEQASVLAKLSIRNKHHSRVWNVEQLCQNIDVCRWFREVGEQEFPSVAKLARVWLGRSSSTAFQERVFSTGSFVMSPLRTRTENERAQRQLIIRHNRAELQRLEESKHSLW